MSWRPRAKRPFAHCSAFLLAQKLAQRLPRRLAKRLAQTLGLTLSLLALPGCAPPPVERASPVGNLRVSQVLGNPVGDSAGVVADNEYLRALAPRRFIFPEDHGAHPRYRSEWWYFTSVLADAQGHEYGVQFTLFRQALSPRPSGSGPWHTGQAYLAHLAVSDISAEQHYHSQRFSRGHPQIAGVSLFSQGHPPLSPPSQGHPPPPSPSQIFPAIPGTPTNQGPIFPGTPTNRGGPLSRGHPQIAEVHQSRGHPQITGGSLVDGFRAYIEDWAMYGELTAGLPTATSPASAQTATQGLALHLDAAQAGEFAVSLDYQHTGSVILQGDQGLSRKGPEAASYYYSLPRIHTSGELLIGNKQVKVSGLSWLDREWSTSVLGSHLRGWDWFALHLHDGRNLMVFNLRRKDGGLDPYNHGLITHAQGEGKQQQLAAADYQLTPTRYWQDERGVAWPVAWRLTLHHSAEVFAIEAMHDEQLMEVGILYWEGMVRVHSAGQDLGRGYMELTGYGG